LCCKPFVMEFLIYWLDYSSHSPCRGHPQLRSHFRWRFDQPGKGPAFRMVRAKCVLRGSLLQAGVGVMDRSFTQHSSEYQNIPWLFHINLMHIQVLLGFYLVSHIKCLSLWAIDIWIYGQDRCNCTNSSCWFFSENKTTSCNLRKIRWNRWLSLLQKLTCLWGIAKEWGLRAQLLLVL